MMANGMAQAQRRSCCRLQTVLATFHTFRDDLHYI
jgi:hypothetical protein